MKRLFEKLKIKKRRSKPGKGLKCCLPIVDKTILILGFRVSLLSLLSYLADWLIYGLIALIAAILYHSEPLLQEFSLKDRRIMYSYYPEIKLMVPVWALIICVLVIPLIISFLSSIFSIWKWPRKLWDAHIFALGLIGALAFQFFVTTIIKNATGKPRPDFLHRCKPYDYTPPLGTLANIAICSNKNLFILWDGYRSFPSGHSTSIHKKKKISFNTILTFFCLAAYTSVVYHFLYNAGRFRIFDGRGLSWKFIFSVIPLCTANFVSFAGISDNRNFLEDVLFGMLLGTIIGWIFYRMYFPSVFDTKNGGKAYPPRRFGIPYFSSSASFYPFAQEMALVSSQQSEGLPMVELRQYCPPPPLPPPPPVPPPPSQAPVFLPSIPMAPNVIVNIKKHPNHFHHTKDHAEPSKHTHNGKHMPKEDLLL